MARIVCQVLHRAERVTFLWSEGAASFEPYQLDAAETARLLDIARQIHGKLAAGNAAELGQLGHSLWRTVLRLDAAEPASAQAIHPWLANQLRDNAVERLQFLSDKPGLIPWNMLCDAASGAGWEQFWGTRLSMGVSRRVNALWANATLVMPMQLCAADLDLVEQLSPGEQQFLTPMREAQRLVHAITSLNDEVSKRGPDVLLLLVRWAKGQLRLGADALDLSELRARFDEAKEGNPDPVVILMGAGAAEDQPSWPNVIEQASALFGGLIANESLLPAPSAFKIGHAIAQRLTTGTSSVGAILQTLRKEHGASALAFSAFCPVNVHVSTDPAADAPPAELEIESNPLPDAPYRPFAAYDASERALFLGRDVDMARAAAALDCAGARGVFLHGDPAVGKTSFLQAALIPHLEQENIGFLVLRDRSLQEPAINEKVYPRLILRSTDDLAGQFADALSVFCARPLTYTTPTGAQVTVDLPSILHQAVTGMPKPSTPSTAIKDASAAAAITSEPAPAAASPQSEGLTARDVWIALRDDRDALARILDAVTRPLPFELVIVIDQGEELITLVRTEQQRERRQKALAMLQHLSIVAPRCKIVFTVRSQSLGQLVSLLHGGQPPADWRTFFLNPLAEEDMANALLWPTNRAEIPYSPDVPFTKYNFAFEEGSAQRIAAAAIEAGKAARISPLPILQAVGALLYERQVIDKKQNVIRYDDVKEFGGVDEALAKCLERKLKRLNLGSAANDALRDLITKLTISHADGTLSRALMPASELKNVWKGAGDQAAATVNRAADAEGLFEIQQLLISGQEELFISVPQDSLAQLGRKSVDVEKDVQKIARGKVIDVLWIMIPLVFLAAAVTFWATRHFAAGGGDGKGEGQEFTEQQKKMIDRFVKEQERRYLGLRRFNYYGQLARVALALDADNALRAQQILMEAPAMRGHDEAVAKFPDLRSFEWYYLKKVLNSERYVFPGHLGPVTSVAVARNNEHAATGSKDGTIRIWSLKSGELIALLTGGKTPVHAVAFAPDGKTLASAGAGKAISLWDLSGLTAAYVEIKKETSMLEGHADAVNALAYGKDAKTLASGGADKAVIIWDVDAKAKKHTLKEKEQGAHAAAVHTLAFTADGKTLVSAGAEADAIVWDAEAGKKRAAIKTAFKTIHSISIAPDGKSVCTGGMETKGDAEIGVIRFWLIEGGKEQTPAIEHGASVLAVAFGPDAKTVASAGADRIVRLFDVASGKQLQRWIGHLGHVGALAFAGDGSVLVSGSVDSMAKAWNPAQSSGPEIITKAHADWVQCLALNPTGTLLASGGRDGAVKLWDTAAGKLLAELPAAKAAVTALAFSSHKDKDKLLLAVGTRSDANEGDIGIYQIEHEPKTSAKAKLKLTLKPHANGITCLAFNPEKADQLASGSSDTRVRLWDVEKNDEVMTFREHEGEVRALAFQADGKRLASGGKDKLLCICEPVKNGRVAKTKNLHLNSIEALAFLPLGPADHGENVALMTGSADQSVGIWELEQSEGKITNKNKQSHLRSHVQPVTAVAYSDKPGRMVASAGADGSIKLYNRVVADSELVSFDGVTESFTLTGHVGPVRALLIAPDQSFLVSAGNDGTIRFWRATARADRK